MSATPEVVARELALKAAVSIGAPVTEVVRRHKSLAWILGRLRNRLPGVPDDELRAAVQDLASARWEAAPEAPPVSVSLECPWCGEETGGVFCDSTCRREFDADPSGGDSCPWCGVETACGGFCSPVCLSLATPARGHEPSVSGQWGARAVAIATVLQGTGYPLATHRVLALARAELRWSTHLTQASLCEAEVRGLVTYSQRYWFALNDGGLDG